jgi:hypothetical protein
MNRLRLIEKAEYGGGARQRLFVVVARTRLWIVVTVYAFTTSIVGVSLLELDRRTHDKIGVLMRYTMGLFDLKYQVLWLFA